MKQAANAASTIVRGLDPRLCPEMCRSFFSVRAIRILSNAMGIGNESNQDNRAISTGKLNALPRLHTRPINVVVYHGS